MKKRVAAIDFGTNTARLLLADIDGGNFQQIYLEREIVRMGGGFTAENGLSPEAWSRGMECLSRFAGIINGYNIAVIRAVATSAVRDAVNGNDFVEAVRKNTGISLLVIDGELEGRLTCAGVICGLVPKHRNILVIDVGGGSTEYTLAENGNPVFVRSLPLGVVRLTEGRKTPVSMKEKIRKELENLLNEMRSAECMLPEDTVLVGTAGTATTLAAISMGMTDYDYRKVNNYCICRDEIESIYERLLPLTPEERLKIPGMEKGREDLIIAGILVTLLSMETLGFNLLKVSDYGLLEGVAVTDDLSGRD